MQTRKIGTTLLRIGRGAKLTSLPSLAGLHKLATLIVTGMYNLYALPSFDDLTALSTLLLHDMTHLRALPSLRHVNKLTTFALSHRNAMCCNGFITGKCDLTDFQCKPRVGEPLVTCAAAAIPPDDLARISSAKGVVCSKNRTLDLSDADPTRATSDVACGGVMYRACYVGTRRGMCYNSRMQVIACDFLGEYEALRRLQIARGVGDKCDPSIEAWLGCVESS